MKSITKTVTNRQLFFMLFVLVTTQTTIVLPKVMAEFAGRSSWLPLLISGLVFGLQVYFITKLNLMFKGKALYDYGSKIVGKFMNFVICIYFIVYFFIIGLFLKINFINVLTNNFLPTTPIFALLLLAVPLFGYVAYKGITNIARMYEILGIMFLSIVVVLCIFMIFQGQKENALPLFYSGDFNIKPLIKNLITPFGGIEILFFIPLTTNNKKVAKHNFLTVIFIVAFFILVVESTIMILGLNNTISFNDAFIEAIKIVRLPVIERTDIFYLTFGLTSIFAGMIATFIGMLEFACKIFSKVKRQYLTIIISILFYIASYLLSIFNNVVDILSEITIILVLTSTIIIPTVLFVIAKFKKSISK